MDQTIYSYSRRHRWRSILAPAELAGQGDIGELLRRAGFTLDSQLGPDTGSLSLQLYGHDRRLDSYAIMETPGRWQLVHLPDLPSLLAFLERYAPLLRHVAALDRLTARDDRKVKKAAAQRQRRGQTLAGPYVPSPGMQRLMTEMDGVIRDKCRAAAKR